MMEEPTFSVKLPVSPGYPQVGDDVGPVDVEDHVPFIVVEVPALAVDGAGPPWSAPSVDVGDGAL